ncbi:MAG: DUF2062 domain-containing protein [Pseudomonadota bacterium]
MRRSDRPLGYFGRMFRRRFLKPVVRSRLKSDVLARTCCWGMVWGLTPSVGLQAVAVMICWVIADRWLKYRFNWPIAMVLTLVTNPFTLAPIYAFYFTVGCGIIQCDMRMGALNQAVRALEQFELMDFLSLSAGPLLHAFAITWLGSMPFVIAGSIGGYYFGRYVGAKIEDRRFKRMARRREKAEKRSETSVRPGGMERQRQDNPGAKPAAHAHPGGHHGVDSQARPP